MLTKTGDVNPRMENKGINMKLSKIIVAGIAVLSCGCLVQSVNAIPTLTLSDGINLPIVVTDGDALDSNPLAGAITFISTNGPSLSNIAFSVSTGLTKPQAGSASAPVIDLNAIVQASGAANLTITFSETGFIAFPGILTAEVGGTIASGGTLTNIVMQNAVNLVTLGPFGPGAFPPLSGPSGTGSAALIPGVPYSLTETAILTFGKGGGVTSFDAMGSVGVPDGGMTLTMLGIGLLAVGAAGRIYRRATV